MADNIFSEFDFDPEFEDTTPQKQIKSIYRPPAGFLGMSLGQTALISMMFFVVVTVAGTMIMVIMGKMQIF